MGCGIPRRTHKREFSSALALKINISLQRTTSNLTPSLSRSNTSKAFRCLNLKLPSSSSKILRSSFNLIGTPLSVVSLKYVSDYILIQDLHTRYLSITRQFMSLVHEVCINNFSIKDGVFIMLVMIFSHSTVKVRTLTKPPFFIIVGQLENETAKVFSVWKELLEFILTVSGFLALKIQKSVSRIKEFLNVLHEGVENQVRVRKINRAAFLCEDAIKAADEVRLNCRKSFEMILEFFKGFDSKLWEITEVAQKCEVFGEVNAEEVVHKVLSNNN